MKKIVAYKSYYKDFMASMSREEQLKIRRVLALLCTENRIPRHFIKYIGEGLYELRITLPNREARLFFTYDGDTLLVVFNCIVKKTQTAPQREIEKANRLKKEYEKGK